MKTILNGRHRLRFALLMGATAVGAALTHATPVYAQAAGHVSLNIPAQPVGSALTAFSRATGVDIVYGASLPNATSPGVSGRFAPSEGLSRLLAGTGLTYRFTSVDTVRLELAPQAADGVIQLGAVRVEGVTGAAQSGGNGAAAGWDGVASSIYTTAGSVSVISRDALEAYPGTTPADVLKNVTGVLSGEATSSGSLDVNIRGMQGQGRVPVTVDGSLNGTTVYRGYQGTSNRTFIDPDFISSIAIEKGPAMGNAVAGGIGGSVSMTTLKADDIVPEGSDTGLRFRLSVSNNTSQPGSTERTNLLVSNYSRQKPLAALRGTDRPTFLDPTAGSGSLVFARKSDWMDLVAGYAFRRTGNYHAGTNGDGAPKRASAPSAYCASGQANGYLAELCASAAGFYESAGSTPFVGGEEVLNTASNTESVMLKATIRPAPDHTVELGYGGYWSQFSENYPSEVYEGGTVSQRGVPSETSLNRFTVRHRWNPENALIDLKSNLWFTQLHESSAAIINTPVVRRYVDTFGADVSNGSILSTPLGLFSADYGVSYLNEETGPDGAWAPVGQGTPGREGQREEVSLFTQMQLDPTDWLRLNGGLRYQEYWLKDKQSGTNFYSAILDRNEDAFSFSLGATVMPADGWQVFATYKQASRLPSLMEATAGFFMIANPDLHGEEARNWEIGANYTRANLFTADDQLGLKLVWFDNDIRDYIARRYIRKSFSMQMYNIDRAKFSGVEASASYRIGSLNIDAGATWYDKVSFCRPGESCLSSSLASDYATNYIPPEFAANLTVSRDFLHDRMNLGARLIYRGERAAAFEPTDSGFAPLLSAIPWKAYTTADLTGRYKLGQGLTLDWSVENLTDRYYIEPLSLGVIPAPGRTFRIGLTGQIGASGFDWPANWFSGRGNEEALDWSGAYAGLSMGHGFGREQGCITDRFGASVDGGLVDERMHNATVGVFGGVNWQIRNNIVLGVEADVMTGALESGSSVLVTDPDLDNLVFYKRLESSAEYSWDWFASLRGRVGYSFGRSLIYLTGGPAFLRETQNRTQYRSDQEGDNVRVAFRETSKANRFGWALGGGVERAIGEHWSFRAEYLYADFGKGGFDFDQARAGVGPDTSSYEFKRDPVTGDLVFDDNGWPIGEFVTKTGSANIINGRKSRTDADMHTVRIGFSYCF